MSPRACREQSAVQLAGAAAASRVRAGAGLRGLRRAACNVFARLAPFVLVAGLIGGTACALGAAPDPGPLAPQAPAPEATPPGAGAPGSDAGAGAAEGSAEGSAAGMAAPHETTREKIPRKIVHRKVRHRRRAVPVEAPAEVAALPPPVPAIRPVGPAGVAGLLGKKVIGTGNEDLGRVVDVLVNDQGELRAAVIDFGGFLGVGNRKIAVDWALLQFHLRDSAGAVTLHLSRKQIQQAPEYKEGAHPDAVLLTREPADSVVPLVDPKAAQSAPSSSSTSSTSNNAGPPNRPAPLEAVHSHAPPVAK